MSTGLIVVAVALLFGGVLLRRLQIVPRVGSALIVVGAVYGVAAIVVPRLDGAERDTASDLPTVAIVRPEAGATVESGERVPLEIELEGAKIATSPSDDENGHLHVYVDGRLQNMPFTMTTDVRLSPGEHKIRVEFVDWQHVSYFPRVESIVEVVARG